MKIVSEQPLVIQAEPTGTRMVQISLRERCVKLAWRMGVASAVTAWLFYLQFQKNAEAPYMLWGIGIFAVGTFLGVRAFGIRERRTSDSTDVPYTHLQRLMRFARKERGDLVLNTSAARYLGAALCLLGAIYFANGEGRNGGWASLAMVICALTLAREVGAKLLV